MAPPADRPQHELWHQRRSRALARSSSAVVEKGVEVAVPHGWTPDDLAWERCQEEAALALRAGDPATAAARWARAFEIADRFFVRGDPRIAASLANQAPMLRRARRPHQAQRMLGRALVAWGESWRWVQLMRRQRPGVAAASHAGDPGELRAACLGLIRLGRAATVALERQIPPPVDGLDLWQRLRPQRFTDLRKLLAAVLLIAPGTE